MKSIVINKTRYNIPTKWEDITLKLFNEIRKLDEAKVDGKIQSDLKFSNHFLSILTGIPESSLLTLTPKECEELYKPLSVIIASEMKPSKEKTIVIDKQAYAFCFNIDKITQGQFIDLEGFTKEQNFWDVAHKICAVFLRPMSKKEYYIYMGKKMFRPKKVDENNLITEEYNFDSIEARSQIFLNKLPMTYIYNCVSFFLDSKKNLEEISQFCTPKQ
ncbi:MAG TPA: hypothetical protein VNX68_12770 [Nitrosopumilaceae archaeon]|jgi:hypothetical protein|nr:hypothetical protein [Nitrosopumilaceae archaeon]